MHPSFKGFLGILLSLTLANGAGAQANDATAARSPKAGWQDFELVKEPIHPWWHKALWYLPNRFLDFIDVVRVDVGAGPSFGAVVRATRYVQAGYRDFAPASLRVGAFGRQVPGLLERSSEFGISPFYSDSPQRKVCAGEVGAGVDLLIIGGYAGICFDELWDFASGIFLFDPKDDDQE